MNYTWFYIRIWCRIRFWREKYKNNFSQWDIFKIWFLYINPYTKIRQNGPKWSNFGVKKSITLERVHRSCWFFHQSKRTWRAYFDEKFRSLGPIFQTLYTFKGIVVISMQIAMFKNNKCLKWPQNFSYLVDWQLL